MSRSGTPTGPGAKSPTFSTHSPRYKAQQHVAAVSEVFVKETLAHLVIDIRAEVAQAVSSIREEVAAGVREASLREAATHKSPGARLADTLQQSEKEALGREFLKAANHELGLRMDYLEKLHSQLSDQVQGTGESIEEALRQLGGQIDHLQDRTSSLEVHVDHAEEKLVDEIRNARAETKDETQELLTRTREVQEQEATHVSSLGTQLRHEIADLRSQMTNETKGRTAELIDCLGDTAKHITEKLSVLDQCSQLWQQQADRHFADLQLGIDQNLSEQGAQLEDLQAGVGSLKKTAIADYAKVRKNATAECRLIVGEIARIQKALHVDYINVKYPGDGDSLPSGHSGSSNSSSSNSRPKTSSGTLRSPSTRKTLNQAELANQLLPGMPQSPVVPPTARTEDTDPGPRVQLDPGLPGRRTSRARTTASKKPPPAVDFEVDADEAVMDVGVEVDDLHEPGEMFLSGTRVRDFSTQTDEGDAKVEVWVQTDPIQMEGNKSTKKKPPPRKEDLEKDEKKASAFAGAEKLKKQAKEASMKPPYNVFDYYHETGIAQRIAKSSKFDNLSLFMVLVNAIWIAVDTDLNDAAMLITADPIFQVAENVFCAFFTWEILVRFFAFKRKRNCLRDRWFVFDMMLVSIMITETWIVSIFLVAFDAAAGAPTSGSAVLKLARLVRLLRLTRMTRLLRAVPELMIILKGLAFASRSVGVFFVLWGVIIYVCSVLLRQLTSSTPIGSSFFPSVPSTMNTLLINGVFSDSAEFISSVTNLDPWMWLILVPFMALVSLTIMYMLVGVLVDVIGAVANSEKERLAVAFIAGQLREELSKMGRSADVHFTQTEFTDIMTEPGVMRIAQESGVDVAVLADMLDLIYEDISKSNNGIITFPDLVEIMLNMRGTNPATVKDCKETIRVTKTIIKKYMEELSSDLLKEIGKIRSDLEEGFYERTEEDDL